MNRKLMTFGFFLFLLLSTVASAQQATRSDIQALESKITNLETTVREMDKRLTNQIVELDKRLSSQINTLFWAIGALIGLVLAVIVLPQLLGYFQEKRARTDFQKQIDELEQRLEQYHREIEELKSRRVVMPS